MKRFIIIHLSLTDPDLEKAFFQTIKQCDEYLDKEGNPKAYIIDRETGEVLDRT